METVFIKDVRQGMKNLTLTFIVLEVGNAIPVKENREVRTIKVADSTACINLSLWGEPGQLLAPGDIIRMTKGYVNIWRHCLTLYMAKGGEFDKIGNFCMVFNEQLNMSDPNMNLEVQPEPLGSNVNNGTLNNGSKVTPGNNRPNSLPPLTTTLPPKSGMSRFASEQASKAANKVNANKTGRGAIRNNTTRPDRR